MKNMKIVSGRTPETVRVDAAALPDYKKNEMCKKLTACIGKAFENPAFRAEYEQWRKEREEVSKKE